MGGGDCEMAAKLQLALCVAMVVLGTALAKSKWETDKADQQRAVLLTKVSMYHEQLQASAKDYAKFTGQKYPAGVVSLEPTAAEAPPRAGRHNWEKGCECYGRAERDLYKNEQDCIQTTQ